MDNQFNKNFIIILVIVSLLVGGSAGVLGSLFVTPILQNLPYADKFFRQYEKSVSAGNEVISVEEESSSISAVEEVSPAVVSIVVSKELQNIQLDPFFGLPVQDQTAQPQVEKIGGGTGFIITPDGLIVTNRHVVEDSTAEYTVILNDDRQFDATVLDLDTVNDLAILKIEGENLPVAELGNSDELKIGQTVIAIGYTLGEYRNTVSKGIVSGINRQVFSSLGSAIQIDAPINPGNSGGPLINLSGQVVGINTAVNRQGEGIGFAIPINLAKTVVDSVEKYGKIIRPWLGVRYVQITPDIIKKNNLKVEYGALVVRGDTSTDLAIVPDSPADKAGLEENDIILEVNGVKLDKTSLVAEITKYSVGDEIELRILHDGNEKPIKIKLEERQN
ncbi:hypothetical protein A2533_00880 [Candidatus Falkowbacteria bacterium RIFOXYD2_FULL_35_9]|uniref:PDZ domain-containing protein n=1 Tax=Candidatus Falkowbacteria bacterium RIFOXYC2_FULL_36_12 TaxID=1798002 RepID=A0A1F5SYS3_9BACT|nr:MAG: hypothetical protein A2300_02080 [Candidatus Falkowbacteria bacterium RIFOXYB2_FULL_35_7]OGF31864.1 MAG: hypothetical protein A2478_05270 [Candidatus Falkowbacteria bacterium RIFOXYC2_FULL_36_12]OGF33879.1 MAG: hypothetical protein A2223_01095 [Candidatus Falkowbacteria bacterium RIFOXYA2_FULL_35_8]OGF45831.1 MAG: hypothetical protein A2533_00880 [Candidatus Falkowbacteria bacterium RIFOXYD2_FULL_35_9]